MITLASFDEEGNIIKLRCYSTTAQFWEDFLRYPELAAKVKNEQPRVNVLGTWGHRLNREDIFPLYIIPEGKWQDWSQFYQEYLDNWQKESQ